MAVGDISLGSRRLNNVGMPIENHQASNKFYVDTVVETATTGDKALKKIQDGIFASAGEIDMSGNSITGLLDSDAAANKNYVDNGGAIAKLPSGAFTAVSDIDFDGFSLKNIPDPIDGRDAVNKDYVDGRTISGDICSCAIFRTRIELNQCDVINFISRATNSKITNAYVYILIELDL